VRIVSGGQTGVDRAALDVALELGLPCGGWCPADRAAEDGAIPARYPLVPLPGAGYRQRTLRNVRDSDATLIIYFQHPSGGTEQTLAYCIREPRPYLLIDASEIPTARAAERLAAFVAEQAIETLNVAGPRAGGSPRAYDYTQALLRAWLAARGPARA
jgi:hypothetical protein